MQLGCLRPSDASAEQSSPWSDGSWRLPDHRRANRPPPPRCGCCPHLNRLRSHNSAWAADERIFSVWVDRSRQLRSTLLAVRIDDSPGVAQPSDPRWRSESLHAGPRRAGRHYDVSLVSHRRHAASTGGESPPMNRKSPLRQTILRNLACLLAAAVTFATLGPGPISAARRGVRARTRAFARSPRSIILVGLSFGAADPLQSIARDVLALLESPHRNLHSGRPKASRPDGKTSSVDALGLRVSGLAL